MCWPVWKRTFPVCEETRCSWSLPLCQRLGILIIEQAASWNTQVLTCSAPVGSGHTNPGRAFHGVSASAVCLALADLSRWRLRVFSQTRCHVLSLERNVTECYAKHISAKTPPTAPCSTQRILASNQKTQAWQSWLSYWKATQCRHVGSDHWVEGGVPFPSGSGTALGTTPVSINIQSQPSRFISASNL